LRLSIKALSDTQATKCELSQAPVSQCRCRCRGLQHGAAYWGGTNPNGPERAVPLPGYEEMFTRHPTRSSNGHDLAAHASDHAQELLDAR
jgi:hypothetical protein